MEGCNITSSSSSSSSSSMAVCAAEYARKCRRVGEEVEEGDHLDFCGIPTDAAELCLARVPPSTLYSVCRSWRRFVYSPSCPPFSAVYALFLPLPPPPSLQRQRRHLSPAPPLQFLSFDPISSRWVPLPSPPPTAAGFLFHHPSFISRRLPVQSVAVSGKLLLIAATNLRFEPALTDPLVFDPVTKKWSRGPPFPAPRRWCAAGAVGGSVYLSSGMGSQYSTEVARSVEKWSVLDSPEWKAMGRLRDGKFSRDAIDAVGWRGKLFMVNVKGEAAKEGAIYDAESDSWGPMPEGMLGGWRGPAAAMEERTIYVVEETKGLLKQYDHVRDAWVEVLESPLLRGAEQMAAAGGKVCVVCGEGVAIAVVDTAARRVVAVVECPPELQAVGIHILPRMTTGDAKLPK
ncbi:hypothetical protein M569_01370 [Genlisea aurea]|uniref:F-box domain-containing protein n=1 Tax=Genlisea aurea TaxID=192259 RepID=S8EBV2_9LAMI|nr:hypothetical protein M569_01370 [Genlisea aurea]